MVLRTYHDRLLPWRLWNVSRKDTQLQRFVQ